MPLPAEAVLPGLRLTSAEAATASVRSYLPDGRCLGWYAPHLGRDLVLDSELDVEPPLALGQRYGTEDFWDRWTRAECAAKLTDVPMAVWLARHGIEVPGHLGLELTTVRPTRLDPRLVVSVGIRPTNPPPPAGRRSPPR